MIIIFLSLSVLINLFLIWYIVQLLKRLLALSDNMDDFLELLNEYEDHIDIVYNLERFYGDSTLESLLQHSKSIVEEVKQIKRLYDPNYDEEGEEEIEEEMKE